MDINAKVAELEAKRNAIIAQITLPLQQISAIDGQLALLREMQEENEKKESKKKESKK